MNRNHKITAMPDYDNYKELLLSSAWPVWYLGGLKNQFGRCIWCGEKLAGRQWRYCSDECKSLSRCAIQDLQVTSVRRYIHKLDGFECQECGVHFSRITPAGIELPVHSGEVDHIIPLHKGGLDVIENLQLLCSDCHQLKTNGER